MTKPKREECRCISLLSLQKHCAIQKRREKRIIKGTIEALLGCKRSWKGNLVLFCGFRFFAECVFEMLLCVDVRLLSFEVKCVCVGGVPVCVSCQSACLALGWGKAPCGMEARVECASRGEPPKPQSDKLTAGMLGSGSSYSLTSTPFFLDSLGYIFSIISNPVEDIPMFRPWETHYSHMTAEYIAAPFAITCCLNWADVILYR